MPASAERVAARDAAKGKPAAFYRAVGLHRFGCILRTAWRKAASERQQRRHYKLVTAKKDAKQKAHIRSGIGFGLKAL